MLTQSRLKELLHYDPETGLWTWLVNRGRLAKTGDIAGCLRTDGYVGLKIDGKSYRAHRLAWLYMHGNFPQIDIDHKDLNKSNNRWINIRIATDSQNGANKKKYRCNTSGSKGVYWRKDINKWQTQIRVNRILVHIGYYDHKKDAIEAYAKSSQKHYGEYSRC